MEPVEKARKVRDEAIGKAKQVAGELVGDEELESEGRTEQNQAGAPESEEAAQDA
ncbi:CsbD family protein [Pseudonocardia sp. CA-107938]|uniref:CsbD family protein n=1 Tax=Pseudonocardia sp. CA-107938 TaxID=3240021 RepID=UPI003D8C752F